MVAIFVESSTMKRLSSSSDSVGALMSICPNSTDDQQGNDNSNPNYTGEIGTMMVDGMDEDGCVEESGHVSEKKRRLSVDQVKALEKNFEVENKLEPERKVKLAQELGLQPRQVAVWFQNRRARWKTKQLERDYGTLKASHDALLQQFQALQRDNQSLLKEIEVLKSKLTEEGQTVSKVAVKEETGSGTPETDLNNIPNLNGTALLGIGDFRDGSSDSDSSAILNEGSPSMAVAAAAAAAMSSSGGILHCSPRQFLDIHSGSSPASSMNVNFNFPDGNNAGENVLEDSQKAYEPQFVKIEEHNFFGDETCGGFFADEQAMSWSCCPDDWD